MPVIWYFFYCLCSYKCEKYFSTQHIHSWWNGISTHHHVFLTDVHFSYPLRSDVEILNGLDLTIECGKVTALVAPSGAGKSTVVQLLARYYEVLLLICSDIDSFHYCSKQVRNIWVFSILQPTQGCITVAGEDIRVFDKREWSRVVSLVNQVYHYKFQHHVFCNNIYKIILPLITNISNLGNRRCTMWDSDCHNNMLF